MFVGAVSDNFDERIDQKIFHAEIVVDNEKVKEETESYSPIPILNDFIDKKTGKCVMEKVIQDNYNKIKAEVKKIVFDERIRIASDPMLAPLLKRR